MIFYCVGDKDNKDINQVTSYGFNSILVLGKRIKTTATTKFQLFNVDSDNFLTSSGNMEALRTYFFLFWFLKCDKTRFDSSAPPPPYIKN